MFDLDLEKKRNRNRNRKKPKPCQPSNTQSPAQEKPKTQTQTQSRGPLLSLKPNPFSPHGPSFPLPRPSSRTGPNRTGQHRSSTRGPTAAPTPLSHSAPEPSTPRAPSLAATRARTSDLSPSSVRNLRPSPLFRFRALTPPLHCGPPRTAARLPYRARPTPSRSATSGPGSSRDPPSPRCNRRRDLRATPAGHARRD